MSGVDVVVGLLLGSHNIKLDIFKFQVFYFLNHVSHQRCKQIGDSCHQKLTHVWDLLKIHFEKIRTLPLG